MNRTLLRSGWLGLVGLLLGAQIASAADFGSWAKKTSLTFSGYTNTETLANFPVLVVLSTNITGFSYGDFQSGTHDDLRFTDEAQTTELNYEVESWDVDGKSYVWVQVPSLAQDAKIYAFWGKGGESAPAYTTNGATWSNGYIGVWHMNEANALDSTANHLDGTASGGVTMTGAGAVGTAATFDGSGLITIANQAILNPEHVSVEAWADIGSIGDYNMLVTRGYDSVCIPYDLILQPNGQANAIGFGGWSQTPAWGLYMAYSADTVAVGDRRHLSGTFDGNAFKIYLNGSLSGEQTYGYPLPSNDTPLSFGGTAYWDVYPTAPYQFTGTLDEIRISNVGRSADWVWATWFNTASNSEFITVGTVELGGLPGIRNETATNVGLTSASLNGTLSSTGKSDTAVTVYWGSVDAGINALAWAHTNQFPGSRSAGSLTTNVSLSTSNITYYYRYSAANSAGTVWAGSTAHFMAGAVTVVATDADASEAGPGTGTFTFYRPATATQELLVVNYTVGGTASNGVDYTPILSGTVSIPAGESNATIVVTPILDGLNSEDTETVSVTLAGGIYAIGSPSVAEISIVNDPSIPFNNTWLGGEGYWTNGANWSSSFSPLAGQAVEILSGSVILDQPTRVLTSCAISNALLTFANFTGTATNSLSAGDVFIQNGAVLTHAANTDADSAGGWQVDGAVAIACANMTLEAGAQINIDGKGFAGGVAATGKGPGGGGDAGVYGGGAGGGYGGVGGPGSPNDSSVSAAGGSAYGTAGGVEYPGSGGGGGPGQAGNGGGLVRIVASGDVTLDGTISANGVGYVTHGMAGSGSGGGVFIKCRRFLGAGTIYAQCGGPEIYWPGSYGGAGGGGRIAVHYDTTEQQSVGTQPTVLFALGGNFGKSEGRPGTLFLSDTRFFPTPDLRLESGQIVIPGFTAWAPSSLTISNGLTVFPSGFQLTVTNNLVTAGFKGGLEVSGGILNVGGNMSLFGTNYTGADPTFDGAKSIFVGTPVSVGDNLTLSGPGSAALHMSYSNLTVLGSALVTNSAFLRLTSSPTNSPDQGYGQLFSVGGSLTIAPDAHVIPYSDPVNGGSVKLVLNGLTVAAGGEINADGNGFVGGSRAPGKGPGTGEQWDGGPDGPAGGAGYGGHGGQGSWDAWLGGVGGMTYGSSNALPFYPGSGGAGGAGIGGKGGGLVWIEAPSATVDLEGLISANGGAAILHGFSASGSGGGIYIACKKFAGNGSLTVIGGGAPGWVGGVGGGGRIAVWRRSHTFTGTASAVNGDNGSGNGMGGAEPGTIFWGSSRSTGTLIYVR